MKKLFQSLLFPLIALIAGTPAYAYDDWQEMTSGVALNYTTAWSPFGGSFTLNTPQVVELSIISYNTYEVTDGFTLYADQSLETILLNTNNEEGAGIYDLDAGTYYFYCNSVWGSGQIMYSVCEGGVTLTINEVVPAEGSSFSASTNDGFLSIYTDFNVYVSTWQFISDTYTSTPTALDTSRQGQTKSIAIYVKDVIKTLHDRGMAEGDPFQIKLTGIKDPNGNVYGEDGTLTINYKVGKPSLDLASSTLDANAKNLLLSYYMPGDESALVSFTFNDAFDTTATQVVNPYIDGKESTRTLSGPVLELACSSTSAAQKLYYTGTYSNDNKTVTFDISGFAFGTWGGALGSDGAEPGFKVLNICDLEGNRALGGSESTPGAYSFSTDYRQYLQASFDQAWTPAAGSQLTATTSVDITTIVSSDDQTGVKNRIRGFESITMSEPGGTVVTIPFSDCTLTYTDAANGKLTISCTTPAEMIEKLNVTVAVNGLQTCDGLTYADGMISADFNPVYVDPSPYLTFGSVDLAGNVTKSAYVSAMAIINVYTDLLYAPGTIPTITCSDPSIVRQIGYVNSNPSTDADGNQYYTIYIGQPIALTAGNNASVVAEGTTLTISFPEKCFSSNLSEDTYDAVDYTFIFAPEPSTPAEPEDFSIALTSPADGSEVAEMTEGEFLFAVTGTPEHAVLYYRLYDNGEPTDSRGQLHQSETEGIWTAYAFNMIYLSGHTYTVEVKGYDDTDKALIDEDGTDVATFSFTGTGTPIEYNHDITGTVSPASGTILPTQSTFTFTFSAPVRITKGHALLPKTSEGAQDPIVFYPVATSADADGLATEWTADIAAAGYNMYKQTYLDILLYGVDGDGKLILNSSEIGSNSYYKFGEWYIDNGSDKVDLSVISPTPGVTYAFDKIVVTFDGETNIQTTWNASAYLLDSNDGKHYLTSDFSNMDETRDWLVADGWTTLEAGSYTLVIEEGYYMVEQNSDYPERSNRELRVNYTLAETPGEEGCDLNIFTDEYFSRPANIPVEYFYGAFFTVDGASGYSLDTTAGTPTLEGTTAQFDFQVTSDGVTMWTWFSVYSGNLTLTIPEGYIVANLGGENVGCKATSVEITVAGSCEPTVNIVKSTPATTVAWLDEIALTFDGAEYAIPNLDALNITVSLLSETKLEWNGSVWNSTTLTPRFEAEYESTWGGSSASIKPAFVFPLSNSPAGFNTAGTYKVNVAEKSFLIYRPAAAAAAGMHKAEGDSTPEYTKAMSFTFTIDPTTGVDSITVDTASEYVVYNLNGRLVMNTASKADLNNLLPGFYIINGKKAFVK